MKNLKSLFFCLIPALFSCSSSNGTITLTGYSLSHNGDVLSVIENSATYENTTLLETDATNLTSLFDDGYCGLFLFTQYGCAHCTEFQKDFCQFVLNHSAMVHRFYYDKANSGEYRKNVEIFNTYYGVSSFEGNTPTLYMGKKGSFVTWANGPVSLSILENTYATQVEKKNGIAYFSKEEAYQNAFSASPETPVYLYDPTVTENDDFYKDNLLSQGQNSTKSLYAIDFSKATTSDRAAFLKDFSLPSFESLLVTKEKSYRLNDETERSSAHSYLSSYWK